MKLHSKFEKILEAFEERSGLEGLSYKSYGKGETLSFAIFVNYPSERLFRLLNLIIDEYEEGTELPFVTLKRKAAKNQLSSPESKLFLKVLLESRNINRHSFQNDFLDRYTKSVSNAETQILTASNSIVFGRRGAGKSMLLLYALKNREKLQKPSVWINMQVYAQRSDNEVITDVLSDFLEQTGADIIDHSLQQSLLEKLSEPDLSEMQIRRLLPKIKRVLSVYSKNDSDLFVFLDDFHVIGTSLQPLLLDILYAFSRGNKIYLKISAIETFTKNFDPGSAIGLEIPQDVQTIKLDYNLTTPEKTTNHIESILNGHAEYSGIKSMRVLCTSADVVPRLTWVSAGVPRDALSIFSQAMTRAVSDGNKKVSVSSINQAASENLSAKLKELNTDASTDAESLKVLINAIEHFCVKEKRTNAFLVDTRANQELYENVLKLVQLRLLHIISEGITIGEAGKKAIGLILDYGFYTGIRAAQSVDLFNRSASKVNYRDLRTLPVYKGN